MANNIDVKDAAGSTVTMKTTDNAGVHTAHHIVDSSALPTGAATEATLAAIDALLSGTLTANVTITNPSLVVVSEYTVGTAADGSDAIFQIGMVRDDALTTLAATDGQWTEGRVNARGATWIAIEDGAGGQVTSFGGGTQYTEDAAAAANPVGGMMMAVRSDSPSPVTDVDGDNIALRATDSGALHVNLQLYGAPGGTSSNPLIVDTANFTSQGVKGAIGHDGNASGIEPLLIGGYASAAAPTAVSSDGDSVRAWFLRNGAQMVGIVDGSGSQITSFGGGTQYTEGDVDTTITGTALMYEDAGNTLTPVGIVTPMPVFVDSNNNPLSIYSSIGIDDAVYNGGDALFPAGAVRDDALTTLIQSDGDWNPLRTDSTGALWVHNVGGTSPGTEYTEDVAAAADPSGPMFMAVRSDSPSAVTDTDGDNIALRADNLGALRVNVNLTQINGHSVQEPFNGAIYASILDGTGNNYLSAGNSTNSTGSGIYPAAMLAQFDDTTPNVPTENRFANLRMSSRRELYVQLRDAAGNERGLNIDASGFLGVTDGGGNLSIDDGGNSITVDNGGTFAVQAAQSGTWNVGTVTDITNQGHLADNAGFTDGTTRLMMAGFIFDETAGTALTENDAAAARVDSKRAVVGVIEDATTRGRRATVSAGGALLVDASATTQPVSQATASNLNAQVVGAVAHDGADSGNPIKIGGKARQTNPTAVADADRVDATFDDIGRQVVVMGQVRDLITDATTTIASSSSETTILAAAASTFHDLTLLVLTNATATAVSCTIKDGTGGTTRMIVDLAANGGAVIPFPRPLKAAANNTNWTCTLSSAAVTVHIYAQAEKNV